MMGFDDIPEDLEESFPCTNEGCFGNVTKNIVSGKWECDRCEFIGEDD